ncbi:PD-(D/E)XK nuclease domain-containing protein [Candidatus Dependentiae bacterium]|nr:PD-(D/E)XK nuclease domain-containing protein [Candidatus Dependentiae bacterium]
MYNPFSLHYLFERKKFDNYWFDVATPQFLRHFLEVNNYDLKALRLDEGSFIANSLRTLSIDSLRPDLELGPLLFQAGYLTISSYDKETNSYSLESPNREVKESYAILLMATLAHTNESIINKAIRPIRNALLTNDMNELCLQLRIIFAQIPYHITEHNENFYHALVQSFFHLLGFESQSEIVTNRGRIDMVVFTKKFTYVFEFKVKKEPNVKNSPEEAAAQIEDRMYYERYLTSSNAEKKSTIVIVGLTFSKIPSEPSVACDTRILS